MEEIGTLKTKVDVAGEGPDVVLVHGIVETMDVWRPTMAVHSDDYRMVAYNTRGHGGAVATDDDYSLSAYAGDIKNIIDEYCDGHADMLIAHSFGCVHTQRLLHEYDDLVDSVTLFHSTAEEAKFAHGEDYLERVARLKKEEIRKEFMRSLLQPDNLMRPEAPTMLLNNPRWLTKVMQNIRVPEPDIRSDIKEALKFDYTEKNRVVNQDDLTVVGSLRDELITIDEIKTLHRSLPTSDLQWINSGHMSMFFPPYFDLLSSRLQVKFK